MPRILPAAALLAAVAAFLAGCAGPGAPAAIGAVAFDEATGAVRGTVLDDDQLPVPDATVAPATADAGPVLTDAAGRFELSFLPAGPLTLVVSARGYLPLEVLVPVEPGRVVEGVVVRLTTAAADRPYVVVEPHAEIVSGASYKLTPQCMYTPDLPTPPPLPRAAKTCGGSNGLPPFESCAEGTGCSWNLTESLHPAWGTILVEGQWRPTTAATGHSFYIDLAAPGYRPPFGYRQTDPEVWVDARSAPPLAIRVDGSDFEGRGLDRDTQGCCGWVVRVYPAQCDLSAAAGRAPPPGQNCYEAATGPDAIVMVEQRIDLYFSFGVHAPLPETYTAVPESA